MWKTDFADRASDVLGFMASVVPLLTIQIGFDIISCFGL